MSELRSAIEALGAEVLAGLPDARVETDLDELTRAAEMIELERLRRIAESIAVAPGRATATSR